MELAEFALGPLETNCFLLHDDKKAAAIDVGGDPEEMLDYLNRRGLTLTHILLTHLHFDHVLGAGTLQEVTQARTLCNERDLPLLRGQNFSGMFPPIASFTQENLDEGPLKLLGQNCSVLATPGHTPGSLSYYFPDMGLFFGGDVLFARSVGRTDLQGGDTRLLMRSIKEKIYTLPESTRVYPGHGPATSVGEEKRANPFVRGD